MGVKPAKGAGSKVGPRKHHCRTHGLEATAVRIGIGRGVMRFVCKSGCELRRNETEVK